MLVYDGIADVFRGISLDGGKGSGNFGHGGRPGKVGGSGKSGFMNYLDSEVIKNPTKHSVGKFIDQKTGKLDKGRQAMHNRVLKKYFDGVELSKKPTIYFNGGGSASGKTSAISKLFPEVPHVEKNGKKIGIVVDPDELKKSIPEYNAMMKKGDPTAAGFAHEESSALAKHLFNKATKLKSYDVLMDGTLAGKTEKVKKKILDAKKTGQPVVGNFCTVDTEEALKRNYLRYLGSGRLPSVDTVIKNHAEVSKNFPEVANLFTSCNLVDNNGSFNPKIIAKCKEGGKIEVLDKEAYDNFLKKATRSPEELKEHFKKMIPQYEKEWLAKPENKGKQLRNRPEI